MADGCDVALYGATGYTGRLIAAELVGAGLRVVLGGRDEARLAAVARDLARPDLVGTQVAAVDDPAALDRFARSARVVVSAAGPFVDLGPPVMSAAIEAGAHFVDITGEQPYLRWAYAQDAAAADAGVTVVNAMGFDVVPTDLAALLSVTAMREVRSVDIALRSRSRFSGGTLRSMQRHVGTGWRWDGGRFVATPPGRYLRTFPFPDPTGPRLGVFIPWGDVVTAPRTTGAARVRTFFCMGDRKARRMHRAWPLVALGWRTGIARGVVARRAAANVDPSPEERRAARFEVLAEARDATGVVQRGHVQGRDPYGLTAALAAYAAKVLATQSAPRGVLTPTQAFRFGPMVEAMAARFDLAWRARSL